MPINNQVNNLTVKCTIGGFHVMPRDHKIIELDHISQDTNFWLSSHNFGKVAIIQKFYYFPKRKRFCMGQPCWITWHIKLWLENQKLASWLKRPSSIHIWSHKSGICFLRDLWSPDITWKLPSALKEPCRDYSMITFRTLSQWNRSARLLIFLSWRKL